MRILSKKIIPLSCRGGPGGYVKPLEPYLYLQLSPCISFQVQFWLFWVKSGTCIYVSNVCACVKCYALETWRVYTILWGWFPYVCLWVYRKFSEIYTTLGIWGSVFILQSNYWDIWTTLDLSLIAISVISQRIYNYYSALSVFS